MKTFPLSNAQKRIWYAQKMYRNSCLFNIGGWVKIYGDIDVFVLKQAIIELIQNNAALRLRFKEMDDETVQYICDDVNDIEYIDFSINNNPYEAFDKWCEANARTPFYMTDSQMYCFAVFKIASGKMGYYANLHHIVADGWSIKLMTEQIVKSYERIMEGKEKDSIVFPPYTEYIQEEEKYLLSEKVNEAKNYWRNIFSDFSDKVFTFRKNLKGARKSFVIENNLRERILAYIDRKNISLNTYFIGLYLIYSYKKTGKKDILIGMPLLGRKRKKERQIFGTFTNTMPFRHRIEPNKTVDELFTDLLPKLKKSYIYQNYPYNFLKDDLRSKENHTEKFFDVCINYYNTVLTQQVEGYTIENTEFYSGEQEYALQIIIRHWQGNTLQLDFDYQVSEYAEKQIDDMYNQIMLIADQIMKCTVKIEDIILLNEYDRQKILFDFNDTKKEYDFNKTWLDLFEDMVNIWPDRTAASHNNRTLSYSELNGMSNSFAQYLQSIGLKKGDRIAAVLEHNLYSIAAITAIMKCGAVYLPIDTHTPIKRINGILNDSKAKFLLAKDEPDGFNGVFIQFDESLFNKKCMDINISESSGLAYIIYTSGTSGAPKGVMVSHKNLMNYLYWAKGVYVEDENNVFALFSPFAFDFTKTSIFLPLISGSEIRIYENTRDANVFTKILEENKATIVKITPSHIPLINDIKTKNKSIKSFIVGGEDLKTKICKKLFEQFDKNIRIYNEYGPTEATIGCMTYLYRDDQSVSVPIGKPISNTQVYLLDKDLKPVPYDTSGEIYISGESLSNGYLELEKETDERFIANPHQNGKLMYKTGDIAYRNDNDDLVYAGRYDNEVKIRGNRVNLSEIEKKALSSGLVSDIVAHVIENDSSRQLCIYVIYKENCDKEQLKEYLADHLPGYMMPQFMIAMDMFPLNENGKIDKNRLPKPFAGSADHSMRPYDTKKIHILLHAVSEVITEKNIHGDSNFYAIGGDSIKAIQISSRLNERGYELSVRDILTNPIMNNMTDYMKEKTDIAYDQGVCSGTIEKTPILEWFYEQEFMFKGYYNQSVLLEFKQDIAKEDIELAIYELIKHHDALRINYDKKTQTISYNNNHLNHKPKIKTINFSKYRWEEYSEIILSSFNKNFDIHNDLLIKVYLIHTLKGKYLCITAHHMVIDSVSWRIILSDFITIFSQIKSGLIVKLPDKTLSFQKYAQEYKKWAANQNINKDFWKKIISKDVNSWFKAESRTYSQTVSSQFELNKELTYNMMTQATEPYNTKTNELLLIAFSQAMKEWYNINDIVIEVENYGRDILETCNVNRTVGWFTDIFPIYLHMDWNDMQEQIKSLKDQIVKTAHKGFEYGIVRYLNKSINSDKKYIRFNYLGEYAEEQNEFFSVKELLSDDDISPDNECPFLLDINAIILDKKLLVKAVYNDELQKQMDGFLICYKNRIIKLIEHCMGIKERIYTPSDFDMVDLTQEEVESLLK